VWECNTTANSSLATNTTTHATTTTTGTNTAVTTTTNAETTDAVSTVVYANIVMLTIMVTNVSFELLTANADLLVSFEMLIKTAVASAAGDGNTINQVQLVLTPGSDLSVARATTDHVVARATVRFIDSLDAERVRVALSSSRTFDTTLAADIRRLHGITAVSVGSISVLTDIAKRQEQVISTTMQASDFGDASSARMPILMDLFRCILVALYIAVSYLHLS